MNVKTIFKTVVLVILLAILTAGAPFGPNLTSPADGSTAGNPPTLCANQGQGDPDGQAVQIRFEAHAGGADHISGWLNVDGSGNVCWTDSVPWSPGQFAWQARSLAGGEQSGASPEWRVTIPAPAPPPGQPTQPPSQSESCWVDTMSPSPIAPVQIGTTVTFTVGGTCSSGVNHIDLVKDGSVAGRINGNYGSWSWNTSGEWQGNHVINAVVYGNSGGVASKSHPYDLSVNPPPPPPSNGGGSGMPSFSNGNLVKGRNGNVYIYLNGEIKHIPNEATFLALGFQWGWINNKGASEDQIETLAHGTDVPDKDRDPAGYAAFKQQYAAYLPGGSQSGGGNSGGSSDTSCPSAPQRLHAGTGKFAVVNDWDKEDLVVRHDSKTWSPEKFRVPVYGKVSVISGPRCGENRRWFEVGYNGQSGWATEISGYGTTYNLIPDGEPLSGPGGSNQTSGNTGNDDSGNNTPCAGARDPGLKVKGKGRVPAGSGAVGLRSTPQGAVIIKIPEGGIFDVLEGPWCTIGEEGHLNWWKVNFQNNIGWVPGGYTHTSNWLEPYTPPASSAPDDPVEPETKDDEEADASKPSSFWDFHFGIVPEVNAATPPEDTCHDQCVEYVRKKRPDSIYWGVGVPNSDYWGTPAYYMADLARKNGGKFWWRGSYWSVHVRGINEMPVSGDIAIWNKGNCGRDREAGHAQYIESVTGNSVNFTDSNADGKCSPATGSYEINTSQIQSGCLSFISSPTPWTEPTPEPTPQPQQAKQCGPFNIWHPLEWLKCKFGSWK